MSQEVKREVNEASRHEPTQPAASGAREAWVAPDALGLALRAAASTVRSEITREPQQERHAAEQLWRRHVEEVGAARSGAGQPMPAAGMLDSLDPLDLLTARIRRVQWALAALASALLLWWVLPLRGNTLLQELWSGSAAWLPAGPVEILSLAVSAAVGLALFAVSQSPSAT